MFSLLLLVSIFVFAGCSLKTLIRDEKADYTAAMIEAGCTTFSASDLTAEKVKTDIQTAFTKYGFDVSDDAKMKALNDKYLADKEVKAAILKGVTDCGKDVPGLNKIPEKINPDTEITPPSTSPTTPEKPLDVKAPAVPAVK